MSDWNRVPLSSIVERVTAKNIDGHDLVMTVSAQRGLVNQESYFGKRVASTNLSGYWVIRPGDFVYNKSSSKDAPWGVVARHRVEEPAVVTPLYIAFRARLNLVDPEYLLLACNGEEFFESLSGLLREGARAHGALNVRVGEFFAATVPLPSLPQQRRIVDLVAAVNAQIDALESEAQEATFSLIRARLALLKVGPHANWAGAMLSGDAVLDWTKAIPDGWRAETLGSVSIVRSGNTPRRSQQERYFDGGEIPWVKTGDLNEGVLDATDECVTSLAVAETSLRLIPAETVLVAMYGGFAQIGRTARLAVDATTNQAISALTDLRADVLPAFLHEVLKAGRAKWRAVAASSRKDPNVTKRDIENFDFPLPPLEQQREILEVLGVMQSSIDSLARELATLRVFRATLVRGLLSESISIPESYDDLLEAQS